ncbi:hypothetical protein E4S99_15150 [Listeria monocytogenes]|uniref:Uncharacterized protein n=2 Tax=Listeria seeligeri TaxID=1640 RepID=A0ABR5EBS7_LISSE|nr:MULTISPECIES: ABC-three component system middle component 7 [Listeria]EAC2922473.1 hypothetical protein [Listeria monocytogenes]EAC5867734.1 hypothetical protein [Listeria monocytogenes]EAC8118452.1 hypothetical protein [Listeria monocytogenes]EAD2104526.1 hypothetical protein [Listeria monocytogenes]EAD3071486.1 hypothetical protein [Listeria monocytogenes]
MFPSKVRRYDESLLSKLVLITNIIREESIGVLELYKKVKPKLSDLDAFISVLELLYLLEKIEYDEEWRVIKYVENDRM